jgi:hypothetical protein
MLKPWEGKTPKPTGETEWAPWLKAAIQRIMTSNTLLIKEQNYIRGTQDMAHFLKIQLGKMQL